MEFLEARVLLSFTGTDVSGTWSLMGMGASGTMDFDGGGLVTGGALQYADGSATTPAGTYAIGPVSGAFSATSDAATKTGAMNGSKDLVVVTTPGGTGAFSNTLSLLVKHTGTTFAEADLNGTWQLYINGDDAGSSGLGSITFDGQGNVTGGSILNSGATTTLTSGNYTMSATGELAVVLNTLRGVDAGTVTVGGWLNDAKDVLALNPPDMLAAAMDDGARLIVAVRQSGAYTNTDLNATWELVGDGYKGAATFDGAGHVSVNGVNMDGSNMSMVGRYTVASDGTFSAILNGTTGASLNLEGSINTGRNFAVMARVPDAGSLNADSLIMLVNSGGLNSGHGVAGEWTVAGTDVAGQMAFDDTSVLPTGTNSSEIAGTILGGSLKDTSDQVSAVTGTYVLTANGGITITSDETRTGAYNSSEDVMAVVRTNANNTLSVLINGGGATFSDSDMAGDWCFELNGNTDSSNGGGTLHFDGEGGITGGMVINGAGREQITGGSYTLNADGTISLLRIELAGGNAVEYVGAMNSRKDVVALSPVDPQIAAENDMPNLTLAVKASGAYTAASVKGLWTLAMEVGWAALNLDGAGHVTNGVFTDSRNQTSSFTGSYTVAANGTFKATLNTAGGAKTFTGAINASRNVIIQNATGVNQTRNIGIMTSAANRGPTMTAMTPLNVAVVGEATPFGYGALLAASNAVDLDGDALTFRITSLGLGTLTINGSAATVGATIMPGDRMTWRSSDGTGGTFTAFSVSVTDGSTNSTAAVAVAINAIVPVNYSTGDMSGAWTLLGVGSPGVGLLAGPGSMAPPNMTDREGDSQTPLGTYAVDSNGALTIVAGSNTLQGALNTSKDVAAFSNSGEHSFGMIVYSDPGTSYSDADLTGTWTLEIAGDEPGSNGVGVMTFDGAGHITSGQIKTGSGIKAGTGDYTVNSDGSVSVDLTLRGESDVVSFEGALNSAKDVLALGPSDFPLAVSDGSPLMLLLTRSAGTYSAADVKGTWFMNGDGMSGMLTFDGKGHVVNAMVTGDFDDVIATVPGTGSYAMSSAGKLTITLTAKVNGVAYTMALTGAMNASRNLMIANRAGANYDDNLVVFTNTQDHAPTLSKVASFPTVVGAPLAVGTLPFDITYDQLRAAAMGMADLDGDTLQFMVTAVGGGTFKLNGATAPATPFLVSSGDTLEWTPLATATGNVTAFSVKAFDGKVCSATALPVVVKTVVPPMISVAASKPTGSELNGLTTAYGQFTITRAYGDLKQPLTVNFTLGGSAVNGVDYVLTDMSVNFTAGQTTALVKIKPKSDALLEGAETAVLTLVTDSDTLPTYRINAAKKAATVKITDVLSKPAAISGATKNTAFSISYSDLLMASGVTSTVENPITFKFVAVKSGTLKINGTKAVSGMTISSGDTLLWTPARNVIGTKAAFGLALQNNVTTSAVLTFSVIVS
jgi:hypothetical protein